MSFLEVLGFLAVIMAAGLVGACMTDPGVECKQALVLEVGGCTSAAYCGVLIDMSREVWEGYQPVEGGVSRVCRRRYQ